MPNGPIHIGYHESAAFLRELSRRLGLARAVDVQGGRRRNVSCQPWLVPVARLLNLFTRRTVQDKHYLVHIPYWYSARRWVLETVNRLPISAASSPVGLLGAGTVARINDRYRETSRQPASPPASSTCPCKATAIHCRFRTLERGSYS